MARRIALITGASAGIGAQFAELCAERGCDLILVARDEARLAAVAERVRARGAKAEILPADLSQPGVEASIAERVEAKGLVVEYLVNNAGFGSGGEFLDLPIEKELGAIAVNCSALVALCHRFGQGMRARGSGRILNIASTAAFQPGPYLATYYATKAFVLSFSEALASELKGTGVTVTCSCPGPVATEFAQRAGIGDTALMKRNVASAAWVALDAYRAMMDGKVVRVNGVVNWLLAFSVRFAPRALVRTLAAALNRVRSSPGVRKDL